MTHNKRPTRGFRRYLKVCVQWVYNIHDNYYQRRNFFFSNVGLWITSFFKYFIFRNFPIVKKNSRLQPKIDIKRIRVK